MRGRRREEGERAVGRVTHLARRLWKKDCAPACVVAAVVGIDGEDAIAMTHDRGASWDEVVRASALERHRRRLPGLNPSINLERRHRASAAATSYSGRLAHQTTPPVASRPNLLL